MSRIIEAFTYSPQAGESVEEEFNCFRQRNYSYLEQIGEAFSFNVHREDFSEVKLRSGHVFLMPHKTLLMSAQKSEALGIDPHEDNFYGGIGEHIFQITKAVANAQVPNAVEVPEGWSDIFADKRRVAQRAFTVFHKNDLQEAIRLLQHGNKNVGVRVKDTVETGGRGQDVATTSEEIEALVRKKTGSKSKEKRLKTFGLTVEPELDIVRTVCVGQSRVGKDVFCYVGIQQQESIEGTKQTEYKGSRITIFRKPLKKLTKEDAMLFIQNLNARIPNIDINQITLAVKQGLSFMDQLGDYAEMRFTRFNVDIIQGTDGEGNFVSLACDPALRPGGAPDVHGLTYLKHHRDVVAAHAVSYQLSLSKSGLLKIPTPEKLSEAKFHYVGEDSRKPGKEIVIYSAVKKAA